STARIGREPFGWDGRTLTLIPSLFGIMGSVVGAGMSVVGAATGTAAVAGLEGTRQTRMEEQLGASFDAAGLPRSYLVSLSGAEGLTPAERSALSAEQLELITQAELTIAGDKIGAAGGGAAAVGMGLGVLFFGACGVAFLTSGLLGWLLVMKKKVLQCSSCNAVVAAS
ncbi:MAG: hypothetical protein WD226_10935, partial [Planctomycetota bacterium]